MASGRDPRLPLDAWIVDVEPRADVTIGPLGTVADIEALRERSDVNVLFILIDTLRADRLGAWGYDRDTSPLLDRTGGRWPALLEARRSVVLDEVLDGLALDRSLSRPGPA